MYSTNTPKPSVPSITAQTNENENADPASTWNENDYFRTPSLTNLRVSPFRRLCSMACCLNIILLCLLFVMMIGITYFALHYYNLWPKKIQTQVRIDCGPIEGFEFDGVVHYLGIPYALAPLGLNQFKKPVELLNHDLCQQAWLQSNTSQSTDKVYLTQTYQPECLQLEPRTDKVIGSENCLYLNIYVPVETDRNLLKPVIILLDGLFFMYNGHSFHRPNPLTLKHTQAIHVTLNYRIGPMGFLTHPRFGQPNLGLYDQLIALRWVRRNIQNFGGDPVNVILFGHGSGATCALALYYSPLGQHLFEKLWISAPALGTPSLSRTEAVTKSQTILQCTKSRCPNLKFDNVEDFVKVWRWIMVEQWLKNSLFNFPSLSNDTMSSSSSSSQTPSFHNNPLLNGILVNDGELINTNQWHNPIYHTSLVIGQTSNELGLYPTPETIHFWTTQMYHQYVQHRLSSSVRHKNEYLLSKLHSSSSLFQSPTCCQNQSKSGPNPDVELEYTSFLTDGRITCPLMQFINQYLTKSVSQPYQVKYRIYHYYLTGKHRQFDPYGLDSYVSQAFHGWDSMLYLRSYLNHSDYKQAQLTHESSSLIGSDQPNQVAHDSGTDEQLLVQTSDLLNQAMKEFAWTGSITQWQPSQPNAHPHQTVMNCVEHGQSCRLNRFVQERCQFWDYMFDNQWYALIWPV